MLRRKINYANGVTMGDFFASAFLRTGFMIGIAGALGVIGRSIPMGSNMLLAVVLLGMLVIMGLNYGVHWALNQGNIAKLGLLSYISVAFLGLFTGIITSIYHAQLIAKALMTTALVFGVTATYGYITEKDMSSLSTVLTILFFTTMALSVVGLVSSFFSPAFASWIFSIESILSIVFNIIFIVFFMDMNKKIYIKYKNNKNQLQLMNVYASYVIFNRVLDLFLNILYLLGKDDRKK